VFDETDILLYVDIHTVMNKFKLLGSQAHIVNKYKKSVKYLTKGVFDETDILLYVDIHTVMNKFKL
jgi:hypothetical protein